MPQNSSKYGFVTSKKIGNAVIRNKTRRRMRALLEKNCSKLKTGYYIFVAKEQITQHDWKKLQSDFNFACKRLELFKNKC